MADKFKKVDKEYVLSDSSVNDYGFRLLTSGYQLDEYGKNPIGYYMHDRDGGVLVRWEDLRSDGEKIYGKPCINLSNPRGQQTLDEVEANFLNSASMGHFVVLEATNDDSMKLPGQTGPTITKWYNRECSLVDIGSNMNALAPLFSKDGKELKLADLMSGAACKDVQNFNSINMNEIKISLPELAAIQKDLGFSATDAAGLIAHMKELKLKADTATADNVRLKTEKAGLETQIDTMKGDSVKKEVDDMLGAALAAGKITAPIKEQLAKVYAGQPTLLKVDLDSRQAYKPLDQVITPGAGKTTQGDFENLQKQTWDEMHKTGKLPSLKANFPDLYKEKYKGKYGVYPS